MKLRPQIAAALFLIALVTLAAACQTANRGTSEVTTPKEQTEPTKKEPLPPTEADASAKTPRAAGLEYDVARPGSDYREVVLDLPDPRICKKMCDNQMRCMAFTYVGPDDENGPRCRLKHTIADRVEGQTCCVSGVNPRAERRLAELEAKGFELNTDRPGADFRSFEMDRPEPSVCQEACQNLIACKAFTYVRPGHRGDKAVCELKSEVLEPVADKDCCISGVKM